MNAEESDHRISGLSSPSRFQPALRGNRQHTGGTLVYFPRYRAVARSMRPHRIPCHRRGNHRWFPAPCGSGPASHRIRCIIRDNGPQQNDCGGKSSSLRRYFGCWGVRSTPACSLLGSDALSEPSSLTERREYALVSLSPRSQKSSATKSIRHSISSTPKPAMATPNTPTRISRKPPN